MKIFFLLIASLSLILWKQCSDEPDDCICTEEFRMYLVTVVDSLGNPVDSLLTTITNDGGKEYNFEGYTPPPFMPGAYFVMTDGYESDFRLGSKKIFFKGTKEDKEAAGEYEFKTDKCLCHVYKVTGPDTLVLK
jgi:hypothetical protein